jgi:hypothetical protein
MIPHPQLRINDLVRVCAPGRKKQAVKNIRPPKGGLIASKFPILLPNQRVGRAGDRDRFAGLNDLGGLAIVAAAASGDADTSHGDSGHKGENHDLEVGAAVR